MIKTLQCTVFIIQSASIESTLINALGVKLAHLQSLTPSPALLTEMYEAQSRQVHT